MAHAVVHDGVVRVLHCNLLIGAAAMLHLRQTERFVQKISIVLATRVKRAKILHSGVVRSAL